MKLAIFDLDNTILKGDSDYSWIKFLIDSGYVDRQEYKKKNDYFYNQYYLGKLDNEEWSKFALSYFKGKRAEDIENQINEFLSTIIEPIINIYALRLLHEHSHNNDTMLLASATNSVIVNPIAKRLGFKNIVSTDVEMVNSIYTGKIQGEHALGKGKLLKVKKWMNDNGFLNFKDTVFYSDSINDLPLLLKVNQAIAVNPDDKLRQESNERSWEIIDLP